MSSVAKSCLWKLCLLSLVLSDTIVNQMEICDALVVIHYDIPQQQSVFASRMWCCRSNFYRQTKQVGLNNNNAKIAA